MLLHLWGLEMGMGCDGYTVLLAELRDKPTSFLPHFTTHLPTLSNYLIQNKQIYHNKYSGRVVYETNHFRTICT